MLQNDYPISEICKLLNISEEEVLEIRDKKIIPFFRTCITRSDIMAGLRDESELYRKLDDMYKKQEI